MMGFDEVAVHADSACSGIGTGMEPNWPAQGSRRTGLSLGSWTYPAELLSACSRAGLLARPVSERLVIQIWYITIAMRRASAAIAFDVPERVATFTAHDLSMPTGSSPIPVR
jgi:hypothetical protein